MTKVRIRKHCKINHVPHAPGAVVDVPEQRAKALTDNNYAETIKEAALKPDKPSATPSSTPAAPPATEKPAEGEES